MMSNMAARGRIESVQEVRSDLRKPLESVSTAVVKSREMNVQ